MLTQPAVGSGPAPASIPATPMTARLVFWAITSALAGFLFGFDTVVISGAGKTIQSLWGPSAGMHGVAMAAALYGTVIWVLISEIFPDRYQAAGQSLGSATHWVFAALLTTFFPKMVEAFAPGYVFLFFCGMMVIQLVWVKTMVPETKGVPLEEIQCRLGVTA